MRGVVHRKLCACLSIIICLLRCCKRFVLCRLLERLSCKETTVYHDKNKPTSRTSLSSSFTHVLLVMAAFSLCLNTTLSIMSSYPSENQTTMYKRTVTIIMMIIIFVGYAANYSYDNKNSTFRIKANL